MGRNRGRPQGVGAAAAPPAAGAVGTTRVAWPLRATDIDVVGHVNNAAYWAAVEDELARRGHPRVHRAEIEFRAGLDLADASSWP